MNNTYKILDPKSTDLKIINTRDFDFSIEKVYSMFSNPDYLKQWFGPKGFTNTFEKFDFQVNGERNFVMHGPDGVDYENKHLFLKIVENELLVWEHLLLPNFQANIRFTKIDENITKLEFIMLFYEKNVYEAVSKFAPEKNEENMTKLEELLQKIYG